MPRKIEEIMGKNFMKKLQLQPFFCPKCGQIIVQTISGAKALCPKCKIWVTVFPVDQRKVGNGQRGDNHV